MDELVNGIGEISLNINLTTFKVELLAFFFFKFLKYSRNEEIHSQCVMAFHYMSTITSSEKMSYDHFKTILFFFLS